MTILVVGDGGVGKTSFIRALADEDWEPRYIADEKVTATDIEIYSRHHTPITEIRSSRYIYINWDDN